MAISYNLISQKEKYYQIIWAVLDYEQCGRPFKVEVLLSMQKLVLDRQIELRQLGPMVKTLAMEEKAKHSWHRVKLRAISSNGNLFDTKEWRNIWLEKGRKTNWTLRWDRVLDQSPFDSTGPMPAQLSQWKVVSFAAFEWKKRIRSAEIRKSIGMW